MVSVASVPAVQPILVIEQEERLEGLGFLAGRLESSGLPYRRLQTWKEDVGGVRAGEYGAIVPLGGNMHAWDESAHPFLADERRLLGEALEDGVPILGICLGAQVLARALGADVREGAAPEIGWLDVSPTGAASGDPVFGHLSGPTGVYHWHMDVFELPPGAVRLASSDQYPNQAFRHGEAWGIQFHPEVDYEQFSTWIANHPGAAAANGIDEDEMREEVRRGSAEPTSRAFREGLFDAFLERAASSSSRR